MIHRNSMRTRRGFSLVEALVVIFITGMVSTSVTVLIVGLIRANWRLRDGVERERIIARIAEQYRDDVHESTNIKRVDGQAELREIQLTSKADTVVHYMAHSNGIDRVVMRGDAPVHRESFLIPSFVSADWSTDSADESSTQDGKSHPSLVNLTLRFAVDPRGGEPAEVTRTIRAALAVVPSVNSAKESK